MLKIAFDIHTLGNQETGNETYATGLLRAIETQNPADISRHYYTYGNQDLSDYNIRPRRLWPRTAILRIPFSTPLALYRDRIDVAHFQYTQPPFSPAKTVLTIHDLSFEKHPEFFPRAMARRLKTMLPYSARKADHIIAVSDQTKRDLIDLYRLPEQKISVIYNGVSSAFLNDKPADNLNFVANKYGLNRPFAIAVGNLTKRKNQRLLIEAFNRLITAKKIDMDLLLVGKATYGSTPITDLINSSKKTNRVRITGFVPEDELASLYRLALFSVYPSLYEGFGLPVVESMACETAVIASNTSCIPEITAGAALLIDPRSIDELANAIELMANNTDLRQQYEARGLHRSSNFSWDRAAEQTLQIYRGMA